MCSVRKSMFLASFLVLASVLLAAPAATAQVLPCWTEPCDPPECTPLFQLVSRQVTAIEFVKKKENGVCVYECDALDTFTDIAQCPLSEDFTIANGYRVRPFFGSFPCPGDPNYPEAGPANPGFCCDTDPRPSSCSW